jgi:hypothetical protein
VKAYKAWKRYGNFAEAARHTGMAANTVRNLLYRGEQLGFWTVGTITKRGGRHGVAKAAD